MATTYSDSDIARLLAEEKPLLDGYQAKIQLRSKRGHKEASLDVPGVNGSDFRLILRQNLIDTLDFSVILAYVPPNTNQIFRLRRYNGKSHEHTNTIENQTFYDYHIHMATERYQLLGGKEDAFAEPAKSYAEYHEAIASMLEDCAFSRPDGDQMSLFDGV